MSTISSLYKVYKFKNVKQYIVLRISSKCMLENGIMNGWLSYWGWEE